VALSGLGYIHCLYANNYKKRCRILYAEGSLQISRTRAYAIYPYTITPRLRGGCPHFDLNIKRCSIFILTLPLPSKARDFR
jgi:hypothetical protein